MNTPCHTDFKMEMSTGVSLLRTAQSLLTGRTISVRTMSWSLKPGIDVHLLTSVCLLVMKMTCVFSKHVGKVTCSAQMSFNTLTKTVLIGIVRPANRDWACQTERCHTLSNKTSLQLIGYNSLCTLYSCNQTRVTNFIR